MTPPNHGMKLTARPLARGRGAPWLLIWPQLPAARPQLSGHPLGADIPEGGCIPRLFRVILPVSNIERAATVYSRLLGTPGERVSPGRHYFNCAGTILACYDPDTEGLQGGWKYHLQQYVYFAVPDLEAALQRAMEVGCTIVEGGIQVMPWGERMFWAKDPFGNPISFVDENTLFMGPPK